MKNPSDMPKANPNYVAIMLVMLRFKKITPSIYAQHLQQLTKTKIHLPLPRPAAKKDVHFLKYPMHVGDNRGSGRIYPDGSKGNNPDYKEKLGKQATSESSKVKFFAQEFNNITCTSNETTSKQHNKSFNQNNI